MDIEKDFVWGERDGYAILEKYTKKYKSDKELKAGEVPEVRQTVINIPSEHAGLPVKEVFDAAFAINDVIEEVNFPDCVEKLGSMVFNQCPNLKKVKLSENIKRLGYFAFNETPLKDSEEFLRDNMFIFGGWLISVAEDAEEIEIPSDVKGIADYAFYFNSKLNRVIIPDSVKYLGMRAFAFDLELDEVYIPDSILEAHWNLFGVKVHIKKLTIPERIYSEQKLSSDCVIDEIVLI